MNILATARERLAGVLACLLLALALAGPALADTEERMPIEPPPLPILLAAAGVGIIAVYLRVRRR